MSRTLLLVSLVVLAALLVASATPGHAMRAPASPAPGTVIGKALGRLSQGAGVMEMLVMLRQKLLIPRNTINH